MNTPNIEQVRQCLLDTLADLRNKEAPMDVDRARAVAQVASVLVDTAKAEVEYIKVAGGKDSSSFLEAPSTHPQLPSAHRPFPHTPS